MLGWLRSKLIGGTASNQFLWITGSMLVLSGILHTLVWLADGSSWEGQVSWRKPILFGVSTGLTLCSLGWITAHLKRHGWDVFFEWLLAVTLGVEVFLITLQQWRGVPSHFNRTTQFATTIDTSMLLLIALATLGILYVTARAFFGELRVSRDQRLALRSGLFFLVISCCIGFLISHHGYAQVEAGLPPEKYGRAGVPKFPHGATIHVLQILPLAAWALKRVGVNTSSRFQAVAWWTATFAFLLVYSIQQTLAGLPRFPPNAFGCSLLVAAAACALIPLGLLFRRRADH